MFCILLRPSPSSPRFPYTTLFRSLVVRHKRLVHEEQLVTMLVKVDRRSTSDRVQHHDAWPARRLELLLRCQDRKSTRLNSSHVEISYAVFCLKKKIALAARRPLRP